MPRKGFPMQMSKNFAKCKALLSLMQKPSSKSETLTYDQSLYARWDYKNVKARQALWQRFGQC